VSEVFELGPSTEHAQDDAIERAARAVREGELVVLPTDTVYGIGARPDRKKATARLFAVKRRRRDLSLPILVSGPEDAARVAILDDRARALAERFWPGGLTLVLPRAELARRWDLGEASDTVGVRMPDHGVALALLRTTGPLAVTSANLSAEPTPSDCLGVRAIFGQEVAVYLCAGPLGGLASTVVDLSGTEAKVLREGAIPSSDVRTAVG
jgi:tRNA threonylcarbamoyl adenosine modification protein (Sua5/YciO/YrdC/YwlC family)